VEKVRARQASLLHRARGPASCLDRTESTIVKTDPPKSRQDTDEMEAYHMSK
jgi:hypothetical protein